MQRVSLDQTSRHRRRHVRLQTEQLYRRYHDFRHSDGDRIDVSAYGYTDFSQLNLSQSGSDAFLDFGGGNNVALVGIDYTTLVSADFIFA
jgi:hypothetical protein